MASDRTSLSQRLRALAVRGEATPDSARATSPAPVDAAEQPTGEIPVVVAEAEQPTVAIDAVSAAEPEPVRTTSWPQSTPTPNFAAPQVAPGPADPEPATTEITAVPEAASVVPSIDSPVAPNPAAVPAPDLTETDSASTGRRLPNLNMNVSLGGLLRRRGADESDPAAAPVPTAPAPEPQAAHPETPAKPSFGERAALRRRAKSLRARRDAGLLELGAIVLDQRRFGDPTEGSLVRRRTDELADVDSELAAIEQVLDDDGPAETVAQLGVVRCSSCATLVGPRDHFCVRCGTARPPADAAAQAPAQ